MAATPKMQMERRGGALYPLDPWSQERLYGYAEGTPLDVSATNAKRRGKLSLYWAGLGTLLQNLNDAERYQWPTTRALHNLFMRSLGIVERLYRLDGSYEEIPSSIAIDNMSDEDFDEVFERIRQLVIDAKDFDPWQEWLDLAASKKREKLRLPPSTKLIPRSED